MGIGIEPYREELAPAVKEFNQRLGAGGVAPEFHFPESSIPAWLPRVDGRRIYQEYYLAVEGEVVRGGFILKHQDFCVKGEMRPLVYYHLPVSEGIVDKAYASVGVHMLRSALKLQPMLFALGMGGFDRPLPKMLKAMGWELRAVPFHFKVNHPARVLRQVAPLRRDRGRRALADVAAWTGAGWLGVKTVQLARTRPATRGVTAEDVKSFGAWADDLWEECRSRYTMVASRDSATLNVLYPSWKSFVCLKIRRGPRVLGWAVTLDTRMRENKYFGDLRVGSIVDGFAAPEDAAAVVQSATRRLEQRGVDLIVSNQSHRAWRRALRSAGFLDAPSNFIFAAAKPVAALLTPLDANHDRIFVNRGDGDGPVNL